MKAEAISYRYKPEELACLAALMNIDALPGLRLEPADEEVCARAIDSLAAAGLVTPAGDQIGLDRLTALLTHNIAHSALTARFESGERAVILWRGPQLNLLGIQPPRGACDLTPFQTIDDLREALYDVLERHAFPVEVACEALWNDETRVAQDKDQLAALVNGIISAVTDADTAAGAKE